MCSLTRKLEECIRILIMNTIDRILEISKKKKREKKKKTNCCLLTILNGLFRI